MALASLMRSATLRDGSVDVLEAAQLQLDLVALQVNSADELVTRFRRLKVASVSEPVLKSRMYQLGVVKEELVQLEVICLPKSVLGAALTSVKELTEMTTAKVHARVGAILGRGF